MTKNRRRPAKLAAVFCIFCLVGFAGVRQSHAQTLWSERQKPAALTQLPNFSQLAAQLTPAVVSIQVDQRSKANRGPRQGPNGSDPFDFFFPFQGPAPREFQNKGLGSGFIIQDNGLILTNNHVVENAETITVSYTGSDGSEKTATAKVIGTAPEYDVALIQTEPPIKAAIAYLGNSDESQIGDWVMAVGSPFGLDHSVSVGIISAKERREIAPSGKAGLYDFIQTDASINPGNSGGPLVNLKGEVIAINTAINAQGQGIGFAIPINMVKAILPQLKKEGKFSRSWVGVKIQPLTSELAQSYGLPSTQGVLVSEVLPHSPALEAGIKDGDVILEFDGKKLARASDLPLFAAVAGIGKSVSVALYRDGKNKNLTLKLGRFPDEDGVHAQNGGGAKGDELGLVVKEITPELQERLNVESKGGLVIERVEPGSNAARTGLMAGDIIVSVDNQPTGSAAEFGKKVRAKKSGDAIRLLVDRRGDRMFVGLRKP